MLVVEKLNVWYGAAQALFDVSLQVAGGEPLQQQQRIAGDLPLGELFSWCGRLFRYGCRGRLWRG